MRLARPWSCLVLLLLVSGCVSRPARLQPASAAVTAVQPSAATRAAEGASDDSPPRAQAPEDRPSLTPPSGVGTPEESVLLQPVTENQTFVTVQGTPRYKIGPGDVLQVLLATGAAQQAQTVVVKANGMVTVAFVEIKVGGLAVEQAAEEIGRALERFYRQLSVEVLVKEYNSKRVSVLGAIAGRGGTVTLTGRATLLEVLAEAGGPASNANLERVRLIRQGGPSVTLNLFRLLEEPLAQTLVVDAGDVLFIPPRGAVSVDGAAVAPGTPGPGYVPEEARRVFVLGEVRNPGAFPLIPNMRVSQALALAGGPTDVAVLESARIVRGGIDRPQFVEADLRKVLEEGDATQDVRLEPSDLIVLPRSGIGNWNAFIAKIRPTLEVLTFPLALPVQIKVLGRD